MKPRLRLAYRRMEHWPRLAWLARCSKGEPDVVVQYGSGVETGPEGFSEAVWPGPFALGAVDQSDLIFGSAGRLRAHHAVFVSSCATVDRLQVLQQGSTWWISNSLPCLAAATGARVDPAYPRYFWDFKSIVRGLTRYRRDLPTSAGTVQLVYGDNIEWDGRALRRIPKPWASRNFADFARYRDFLRSTLVALRQNLEDPERRYPYRLGGTISSGYDSPCVAALAREAGLREVISFHRARGGAPDSGSEVAACLGLKATVFSAAAWRERRMPEVPFIAADAKGEEVYFAAADRWLGGRALLTGFQGDEVWDRVTSPLRDDLVRGDVGGLSLSEYRLWAGFQHCPVPFLGARQLRAINRISRSAEMKRWHVGGHYSRPICRRVLEEAGVPASLIAREKRQASVLLFHRETFLSAEGRADYAAWLRQQEPAWRDHGRTPPLQTSGRGLLLRRNAAFVARALLHLPAGAPSPLRRARSLGAWLASYSRREPLFDYVFPWALDRAVRRYAVSRLPAGREGALVPMREAAT